VLGVALYLLIGTRSLGVVAIPAILLAELWRERRVRGPLVLALSICLALALAQGLLPDSGYLDQLRISPASVVANLVGYAVALHSFWDAGAAASWTALASILFTGLAVLGFGHRLRRGLDVFDFFVLTYLAAIVAWPDNQGARFLVPILPVYLLYSFQGAATALPSPPRQRAAIAACALLAAACFAAGYAARDRERFVEGVAKPQTTELFEWVRTETPTDAAFLFFKPRVLSLYTGRPAGVLHEGSDASRWEFIESIDARFLVLSSGDPASTRRFVQVGGRRFEPVWDNADFAVLRILRPR
jgi:hypothetical protein